MADLLVIPTARAVPPELQAEFGAIPPALIPLDGRPALAHMLAAVPAAARTIVAAHEHIELLRDACPELVDVGDTRSVGETVAVALAGVDLAGARLVVNFADTVVGDLPPDGDAIAYRVQEDTYRWTAFERAGDGTISAVHEKGEAKPGAMGVFVGVFAFADAALFAELLAGALGAERTHVDPFYEALVAYVQRRPDALYETAVWHDFGHLDTYYRTRQRFFIDRRSFNDVEVDARRGVIRKSSAEVAKLGREVAWYRGLPADVAHLAPRVLGEGDGWVDLEFYGYPPLAEAYLWGAWDVGAWALALDAVADVADALHAHRADHLHAAAATGALRAMYVDKTAQRLSAVTADPAFDPLRGETVRIDGAPCLGLDGAIAALPRLVEDAGLLHARPLTVIHGDLCLSNILYDRRNGIVRLIDPRGDFGGLPLHGDPLYDAAKLAHSIDGDYDHLVRGLFDLSVQRGEVTLRPHLSDVQRRVKEMFARRAPLDARVRLIEGLLFLTMVPLHGDRPRSQLAFLARGLAIVSAVAAGAPRQLAAA